MQARLAPLNGFDALLLKKNSKELRVSPDPQVFVFGMDMSASENSVVRESFASLDIESFHRESSSSQSSKC